MRPAIRVLLIDDEPAQAWLVRECLQPAIRDGLVFETAETLADGLVRLETGDVQVLLLDLSLPDSLGPATFAQVHARFPRLPVVIFTSMEDEAMGDQLVQQGAQDYLVKGQIEGTLLYRTLRHAIERKQATEDKHRLEEQLRQAAKMEAVGRLAGGIAHDFNNLTAGILGYCEILLGQEDLAPGLHADLSEIRRAAERAAGLTRQLLAFSRKQIIAPVVLDLNLTVQEAQRMLSRLIGEDVTLEWSPGHPLGRIKADPGQIAQILVNLAVNARDAMPNGGRLTIETQDVQFEAPLPGAFGEAWPGHWVMLAVSDTGCGMSRDVQEHIFEPFFTTKEQGKGTGLGLATVYGIVEQHGGFIKVASEPGLGATFKVYFPRVAAAPSLPAPAQPLAALPRGHETILLVEDEPMVRNLVRRILERLGYQVLEAAGPTEALAGHQHRLDQIALLLTDVIMPGMNGRQLCERLRTLKPGLRTLFMSGYTQDAIAHHGVLEEGISFIPKPCAAEELARKVRQVLDA